MKLEIKNFAAIAQATIECNGLTVIAGENDTGKSTSGQLIFSIVKALSKYEQTSGSENKIKTSLQFIHGTLSSSFENPTGSYLKSIEIFQATNFLKKINNLKNGDLKVFFEKGREIITNSFINRTHGLSLDYGMYSTSASMSATVSALFYHLKTIEKLVSKKEENTEENLKKGFQRVLASEFKMEVSPKHSKAITEVIWKEGSETRLEVKIKNDEITAFNFHEKSLSFDDVTFIESPIILQLFEIIDYADTFFDIANVEDKNERISRFGRPKVSLHTKDLMNKLKNAPLFRGEEMSKVSLTSENIQKIINGGFDFNQGDSDFVFAKTASKNKSFSFKSINTASGIKAFGLIQLLLMSGIIDKKSLLVIDEPETHLHPKWQVEYARILVELVKNDIKVLVTSHSPYFIQAVKHYSEIENIKDKLNYYLAEQEENTSSNTIQDVTNDLNRIFVKLSQPLEKLVWQQ